MPVRKERYVRYLPSSFNALMGHLKDEEERNKMRGQLVTILNQLVSLRGNVKVSDLMRDNSEIVKKLIGSHFPPPGPDEEARRLQAHNQVLTRTCTFAPTHSRSFGLKSPAKLSQRQSVWAGQRPESFQFQFQETYTGGKEGTKTAQSQEKEATAIIRERTKREIRFRIATAKRSILSLVIV